MTGKVIASLIHIVIWKIKYGAKIQIAPVQGLEKTRIEIDKSAKLVMKEKVQNRGSFYIGCKGQGELYIGGHCFFNTNASITCMKKIRIGEYSKFGNNLVIVDHDHNFRDPETEEFTARDIIIGKGVWVGANCVILKGTRIGDHAVIAAGSIVRGDVPPYTIYHEERKIEITKYHAGSNDQCENI